MIWLGQKFSLIAYAYATRVMVQKGTGGNGPVEALDTRRPLRRMCPRAFQLCPIRTARSHTLAERIVQMLRRINVIRHS
jgi:hypothetical protein